MVISRNCLKYHLYAGDTQLYISFKPAGLIRQSSDIFSSAFSDIVSWTQNNKLKLNPFQTELLLIDTSQQRKKLSDVTSISLGNTTIPVSTSTRNLGIHFRFRHVSYKSSQLGLKIQSFPHFVTSGAFEIWFLHPLQSPYPGCVEQAWLLQFIICWHEQAEHPETPACSKFSFSCHHTNSKVSAHHSSSRKIFTGSLSLDQIEYKISLLIFKAIMNVHSSYLHQLLIPHTH